MELKRTSIKMYRFAYDSFSMRKSVNRAIALLKSVGINQSMWYVLVGFKDSLKEDIYRINHLRFTGQRAYIQRYDKSIRKYIPLARWQNQKNICNSTVMQFFGMPEKSKYNSEWFDQYISEVGMKVMSGPVVR
jgi:hypothetical protein